MGAPTFALGASGDTQANLRTSSYNFYLQDDFRLRPNRTLNYGLRYEFNRPPVELSNRFTWPDLTSETPRFIQCGTEGVPRACQNADGNNVAPRLGLAWSPFREGATVFRLGYGIFYDVGILNYSVLPRFNPPNFQISLFFLPSLANPLAGPGIPLPLLGAVGREFPQAYGQHWSLNLQQPFLEDFVLEAGYFGSKGTNLVASRDLNQPRPGTAPPFPAYGPISITEPSVSSSYHGLLLRIERRFREGLSFLASYTFSKALDMGSAWTGSLASPGTPQDSLNRWAERGRSDFHNRHRFVLSYVAELPFGRGRRWGGQWNPAAEWFLGSWPLSGIVTLRSDRPFTPLLGGTNDSNTNNSTGFGTGTDRPNQVGNPRRDRPDPARWINVEAFE